jgi:hypothetical protein
MQYFIYLNLPLRPSNLLALLPTPWNFGILEFALFSSAIFLKKEYYFI